MKFSIPLCATAILFDIKGLALPTIRSWSIQNVKSVVTFGDSFTDETRISYFGDHRGSAPPLGWIEPISSSTSTGGYVWARYLSWYAKANLYNYAVSGAVCSNNITPRIWDTTHQPFPSVLEYEVPAFIADKKYTDPRTKKPFLDVPANQTTYAIWIGTNDLSNGAFLTNSQKSGTTLTSFVDCVFESLDDVYGVGGRYFVLMNLIPLDLLPQYQTPENGGVRNDKYWRDKPTDLTGINRQMRNHVDGVNEDLKNRLSDACKKYPGSHFALFDTHKLFTDIWNQPKNFLNGTAPPNVQGWVNHCDPTGQKCTETPSKDSYMWYDELHPSEQTDRVVAREFVKVLEGKSAYATYYEH